MYLLFIFTLNYQGFDESEACFFVDNLANETQLPVPGPPRRQAKKSVLMDAFYSDKNR
jgi:hypothetical protein